MSLLRSSWQATASCDTQRRQQHRPLSALPQRQTSATDHRCVLTRQIRDASSIVELLQLHGANRGSLDDVHLSALFGRLASACSGNRPQFTSADSIGGLKPKQRQRQRQQALSQHVQNQQHQQVHADRDVAAVTRGLWHLQQQYGQQQRPQGLQQSCEGAQRPATTAYSSNEQHQGDGRWQLQQQMQDPWQHQQLLLSVLLDDLQQHIPNMRPRAVSSILWALAKLRPHEMQQHQHKQQGQHQKLQQRSPADLQQQIQQVVPLLLYRAHQQLGFDSFEPRQLCSMAYALTRLQHQQHSSSSRGLRSSNSSGGNADLQQQWEPDLLGDLYHNVGKQLHCCSAQDAAQAVYTLAQLQYAPPAGWLCKWLQRSHQLLPHFTPQGLANSAYGLVRVLELLRELKRQNYHSGSNGAQQQQQEQADAVARPAALTPLAAAAVNWLQSCMRVSVLHLESLQPGELYGQLLWACGKLKCSPTEPAHHHILQRGQALLADCDTQQLATALYCFALLGQPPPQPWLLQFWGQVASKLDRFQGLGLAKLLWSIAQLQLQPPEQLTPRLVRAVSSQVNKSNAGCLVSPLYCMVVLGWRLPDRYLVRFQAAVLLQLQRFSSRDFSNMLWALATERAKVDERWLDRVLMASASQLPTFSPTDLSMTVWAVAKLQHKPARQWLLQLLSSSLHQLPAFQPQHFANTLWGLSRLEAAPSPLWLSNFWSNCGQCLTEFGPAELTATVSAAIKLQLVPPVDWLQSLTAAVNQNLAAFDSSRLLYILQALNQLHARRASSSMTGMLQYGSSNGSRGYIYSSSIVPVGRLQWQRPLRLSSGSNSSLQLNYQQGAAVDVLQQLDSSAAEAYSMACLLVLMPHWLQRRVAHWPKQLAAERTLVTSGDGSDGVSSAYYYGAHVRQVRERQLVVAAA